MELILILFLVVFAVCFVGFSIKNELTYQYRQRANRLCFLKGDWEEYHAGGSYDRQLWNLRIWTFKQYFPTLAQEAADHE